MAENTNAGLEAQPGNQAVLMAEVRYGVVFGEMNELFYGRIHRLLLAFSLFAGTLAGSSGLGAVLLNEANQLGLAHGLKLATLWLGIAAAASLAIRQAFRFDAREAAFRKARQAFQNLEGKGWSMAHGTLLKEIARLRKEAPAGGSWLASSAFNKACEELGHPERHRRVPAPVEWLRHALAS